MNNIKKRHIISLIMIITISFIFGVLGSTKVFAQGDYSPAKIIVVTDQNRKTVLSTKLPSGTGETYNPADRNYQHCACCCQTGDRIWACWNSGGPDEPHTDMYAVLVYSDDYGKTWVDPAIIIDYAGQTDYTPYMFVDDLNRFWVTWNYNGTYAMIIENPEAKMENIKIKEKGKIFPRSCSSAPIVLKDGTYLATIEGTMPNFYLYASTDKGETWSLRYTFESHAEVKYWSEGHVVELQDGTLMLDSRIEKGDGYEIYTSTDKGVTWSDAEYYRGEPFVSCGTKSSFITLSNGNVIFATNDSRSKRENMTIWISSPDANSWSDGLLLDSSYSEYPTACELKDGRVFVIWTRERKKVAEMRCAILTQDDIKKSTYTESKTMILVSRGHQEYKDIVSTNLKSEYRVDVGTSLEDAIKALPKYIKIVDESGSTYAFEIKEYTTKKYKSVEGTYTFDINIGDETFQDIYNLLHVTVRVGDAIKDDNKTTVNDDTKNKDNTGDISSIDDILAGCTSSINPISIIILIFISLLIFVKKIRNKKYE